MENHIKNMLFITLFLSFNIYAQCWSKISSGAYHNVAIKTDSTIWGWGYNTTGCIGDGSNINRPNPVQIGQDTDWKSVSCGDSFTLGIKLNGTLWGWGFNQNGQLGDGTYINRNSPIQIGLDSDWKFVASSIGHSLALKTNGTLWTWGDNQYGQFGNGTNISGNTPIQIGLDSDWLYTATGYFSSFAIKTNGKLYSWGFNETGQLGDGTNTSKNFPQQVGTDTDWKLVKSGYTLNTFAIKTNGTLWGWGINLSGQLGDGTNINRNSPSQIGLSSNWKSIITSGSHCLSIKTDGTLWAWGSNNYGQLGDGTAQFRNLPTQIGINNNYYNEVSVGQFHSCIIDSNNALFSFGNNTHGELGNGTYLLQYVPIPINCSSLENAELDLLNNKIIIYPNPNSGNFIIKSNYLIEKVETFTTIGQKISEIYPNNFELSVSELSSGIYFLKIRNTCGIKIIKIIVKE